jgi:hypothetical protein
MQQIFSNEARITSTAFQRERERENGRLKLNQETGLNQEKVRCHEMTSSSFEFIITIR